MRKKILSVFILMLVMSCMFGLGTVMMTFAAESDMQASVPETIFDDYDDLTKMHSSTILTNFAANGDGAGRYQGDVNQKVLIGYATDKAIYATNGQNHATVVQYVEANAIAGDLNFYEGDADGNFTEIEYFSKTYTSQTWDPYYNARNVYEIYFDEESKYFAFAFDNWRGWEVTVGSITIDYVTDVPSEKPYADRTFSGLALGANMDESNNLKMDNAQYRGTAEDPWYIDNFQSDAHYGYYALTSASAEGETWFTLKTNQHTRLAFMSAERNGDNGELNFSPFTFSYVNEQGETVAITEDNINRQIQIYDHMPEINFSQWCYVAYSVYFPETAKAVTVKFGNNRPGQQFIIAGASEAQNTEYEYMLLDNYAKPESSIEFNVTAKTNGKKITVETDVRSYEIFSGDTEGIAFLYDAKGTLIARTYGARSGETSRKYCWEFNVAQEGNYTVRCIVFQRYVYATSGFEPQIAIDKMNGTAEVSDIYVDNKAPTPDFEIEQTAVNAFSVKGSCLSGATVSYRVKAAGETIKEGNAAVDGETYLFTFDCTQTAFTVEVWQNASGYEQSLTVSEDFVVVLSEKPSCSGVSVDENKIVVTGTASANAQVTAKAVSGELVFTGTGKANADGSFTVEVEVTTGKTYSVSLWALGENATLQSEEVNYSEEVAVAKIANSKPLPPKMESNDGTSVTVVAVENAVYKLTDAEGNVLADWQTSNTFTGLKTGTTYKIYIKILETDEFLESPESNALQFVTAGEPEAATGCGSNLLGVGSPIFVAFLACALIGLSKKARRRS